MLIEILLLVAVSLLVWILIKMYLPKKEEGETKIGDLMTSIQEASKNIGAMSELGRNMQDFKKDFEAYFSHPKLRGNIGEQVMENCLKQVLPKESFKTQYKFKQGKIVDAVVNINDKVVPIDSKFPIDNFKKMLKSKDDVEREGYRKEFLKDVKKHIDKIAASYILPAEKTLNFALMYVPSESVYYELIQGESDIYEYARKERVFIVSPNSFYYFLQSVMLGLEGQKIEERAQMILDTLKGIHKQAQVFESALGTLNNHVKNAKNSMDNVNSEFQQLNSKIEIVNQLK